MSEIKLLPENLKIPENWNFPEKFSGPTDIVVDQVDESQNYLRLHFVRDDLTEREKEYFFSNGQPVYERETASTLPHIFHWGEVDTQYTLELDLYKRLKYFFVDFSHREGDLLGNSIKQSEKDYDNDAMIGAGGFTFSPNGEIKMLLIGMPFVEQDGNFIPVADIALTLTNGGNRFNANDYRPTVEEIDPKYMIADRSETNKIILNNIQGQDAFITEWGIKTEEDKRGIKAPFFVVTRSHSTTGTVQTLRSPMQVDLGLITESAFSRPPYPKDDKGRLVVPWRNLDRLVGASISYSYPPPKQN